MPEDKEVEITRLFGRLIEENQRRRFSRETWEGLCKYVLAQDRSKDQDTMIRFFKNKTIGYRNGRLQKAFAIG